MKSIAATALLGLAALWSLVVIVFDILQSIPLLMALSHSAQNIHHGVIVHWASPFQMILNFTPLILFIIGVSLSQKVPRLLIVSTGILLLAFFIEPPLLQQVIEKKIEKLQNTAEQGAAANP